MGSGSDAITDVVATDHLTFAYGSDTVLDDVTFRVRAGEFAALVGPNGSGKSTLLRLLLGLLRPRAGRVALFGADPTALTERNRVGYVPQRLLLQPDLPATVEEVVQTGRLTKRSWWRPGRADDRTAVDHALHAVALEPLRKRRVRELSGGQQQRVLIAKALAGNPELLILDEPIAGVDAESQELFRDSLVHLVRQHAATVLLVSHELDAVADDLDRVVVLKRRVVFDGPPSELAASGVHLGVHAADLPRWLEDLS